MLAVIAFGSLLFVPFTEQYARESVPERVWTSPQFKAVNRAADRAVGRRLRRDGPLHMIAGSIDTTAPT